MAKFLTVLGCMAIFVVSFPVTNLASHISAIEQFLEELRRRFLQCTTYGGFPAVRLKNL